MKIAIIRLSSLGDIISTLVFLEYLKSEVKDLHITWIVDSNFREILQNSSFIDEICDIPLRKSKRDRKLIFECFRRIRNLKEFELVLDFQGLIKSAIIGKILKTKKIIGYDKFSIRERLASLFYTKKVSIAYNEHILKRQYAILQTAFNLKKDFSLQMLEHRDKTIGVLESEKLKNIFNKEKKILFILEASKEQKEYPLDSFYQVALGIEKKYRDVRIYLIWDKKESEIKNLASRSNVFYFLPHLNLAEIKFLISNMNLIIGGDTGLTHLSWALKIPSITLYGNTPIERFRLDGENHISICKIKQEKIVKNDFSIAQIEPELILSHIKDLLK